MKIRQKVEYYLDEFTHDDNGNITHTPFEHLFYKQKKGDFESKKYLSFMGAKWQDIELFNDVKMFFIEFSYESSETLYREAWADSIRAEVLKRLLNPQQSWYLSFNGDVIAKLLKKYDGYVQQDLYDYLAKKIDRELALVTSKEPFGCGNGVMEKVFFEVHQNELDWVVAKIWGNAYEMYPIEGYCLPSNSISLIQKWNQRPNDVSLFKEILENSPLLFYTYPEEHRHFAFLSNQISSIKFQKNLNLMDINRIADALM